MLPAKTNFEAVFRALVPAEVQFIVLGGVLKQAAGRPKDLEPIAELQALLEEKRKLSGGAPSALS